VSASNADVSLVRAIGARRLTAGIINATVGAGIFVLPATVAAGLGPAAPLAYLVCAVVMALILLCFASAGSRVPLTGGLYAYIEVAFGPAVGFVCGVLYWLMALFAVASVASAFAASVGVLGPAAATTDGRAVVLVALFALLAFVNVRGVSPGAGLVETVTAAKLVPLLVLVGAGMWFVHVDDLRWTVVPALPQVGRTAVVLIFAFFGVEVALVPSGEIQDPAKTVPRALFLALAATTTLYVAIQAVAQGVLGPSLAGYSAAPLAEAAARVLGSSGRLLVLGGATVSMFGYVSGDMLGTPRALFALGRDGVLPGVLARVHPRFLTPHVAVLTHGAVAAALAATSSFSQLVVVGNVAGLSIYLVSVAASYALQRRGVRMGGEPFTVPGGPLVPILAGAAILWLLSHATWREFAVEAAVILLAGGFYVLRRDLRT
jgi:APA family basic amino acid/polyamine antiporter